MASIAKKFLIASLIYFILGLMAQAVAVFDLWLGFNPLAYTTVIATERILLVGWLSQLALALIYDRWLVPARLEPLPAATSGPEHRKTTSHFVRIITRPMPLTTGS